MTNYNPFGKPLDDLTIEDLNILVEREIAEGFYIEYKSDFQKSKDIAKSLASFANTYGGWYFIGIDSESGKGNIAREICGFDHTQHKDPVAKLLDPARDWISHMPLMFYKLLELNDTHSVLVVQIPEGTETPYITKDGVIYRRKADASKPIAENDRYTVDKLVNRGRKEQKRFRKFCKDERVFTSEQDNIAWINIYFQPQPRGLIRNREINFSESIKHLIESSNEHLTYINLPNGGNITGNVPLTMGNPVGLSVILRQTTPDRIAFNSAIVQLYRDGSAKIHVPIFSTEMENFDSLNISINGIREQLLNLAPEYSDNYFLLRFANLGESIWSCVYFVRYYIDWLISIGWNSNLWNKIEITNVWRVIPLINSEKWVELVEELGLPISQYSSISVPTSKDQYLTYSLESKDNIHFHTLNFILQCFGLPAYSEKVNSLIADDLWQRANNSSNG